MLAQRRPAQPVSAQEEDGAEADREVPVGRRRQTGKEGVRVMSSDRADGLAGDRRHRCKRCGNDRCEPEERCGDRRGNPRGARLRQQRRFDNRRHRNDCRATAAVHPSRGEHGPGGRGDQRDAEGGTDLEGVVPNRLGFRARAVAELNAAVDPGFHRISLSPMCVRPYRARPRDGPPTSPAPAARRQGYGAPVPWRRRTSAR